MTFVKPLHPRARRPRPRTLYPWDDEVEVYDMRDSIRRFTSMLLSAKTYSLRNISFSLITQCLPGEWEDSQLLNFYEVISEPLRMLNGLNSASLLPLLHAKDTLRINSTQYIPDLILSYDYHLSHNHTPRSRLLAIAREHPSQSPAIEKFFWLPSPGTDNRHQRPSYGTHTGTLLEARLHLNNDFTSLQLSFEQALTSPRCAVPSLNDLPAHREFHAFDSVFNTVCFYYPSKLPSGKDCYLHRARVAREKGDSQTIFELKEQLRRQMDRTLEGERTELALKRKGITTVFRGFDMQTVEEGRSLQMLREESRRRTHRDISEP
jgi:hypothetical protein